MLKVKEEMRRKKLTRLFVINKITDKLYQKDLLVVEWFYFHLL